MAVQPDLCERPRDPVLTGTAIVTTKLHPGYRHTIAAAMAALVAAFAMAEPTEVPELDLRTYSHAELFQSPDSVVVTRSVWEDIPRERGFTRELVEEIGPIPVDVRDWSILTPTEIAQLHGKIGNLPSVCLRWRDLTFVVTKGMQQETIVIYRGCEDISSSANLGDVTPDSMLATKLRLIARLTMKNGG